MLKCALHIVYQSLMLQYSISVGKPPSQATIFGFLMALNLGTNCGESRSKTQNKLLAEHDRTTNPFPEPSLVFQRTRQ
jgi:hypothetical protein